MRKGLLIVFICVPSFLLAQQKQIQYLTGTVQGKLHMAGPDTSLFIRLFDGYALSDAAKPHPELPVGDISFLDCIPPIGAKLAMGLTTNTGVFGPHSELNHLSGAKKRTLYFYFGMPGTTNSKEQYSRPALDNVFIP